MQEVLITATVFVSICWIIKLLVDARTRNKLIDKGIVDEKVKNIFGGNPELQMLSSLKWGMVLVGIGLAALLSQLFPYSIDAEIAFGLMFIFAGVAFLAYYPIADRKLRALQDKRDTQMPNQ